VADLVALTATDGFFDGGHARLRRCLSRLARPIAAWFSRGNGCSRERAPKTVVKHAIRTLSGGVSTARS
jgi:hypothetical protein